MHEVLFSERGDYIMGEWWGEGFFCGRFECWKVLKLNGTSYEVPFFYRANFVMFNLPILVAQEAEIALALIVSQYLYLLIL